MDLDVLLYEDLVSEHRANDGLLHPSSHLLGSLRHAMLEVAGAPTKPRSIVSEIRLKTGKLWHDALHNYMRSRGLPIMAEVDVTEYLPIGWSGHPDWVLFDVPQGRWKLIDIKTTKGEAIKYRLNTGVVPEHRWQMSAYYYALTEMGFQLDDMIYVWYIPMNDVQNQPVQPLFLQEYPVPREELHEVMESRWNAVQDYIEVFKQDQSWSYVNDLLAPVPDREQRAYWNNKTKVYDLKYVPPWYAQFCPYESTLCNCKGQGSEKIGEWDLAGYYHPRKGYEDIEPDLTKMPTKNELQKRRAYLK